ncbi:MAG: YafY family protein [Polyangiales bacterium]
MRRQARLFAIAEYLRGRRSGVTADALAARFQVTVRTIYRDLDALREGHLPVQADRGRGGGYALERHYSLPPINFTAREAAVLLTVGRFAASMRLIPFLGTLSSAMDKVRSALSASAQRELVTLTETLEFVGIPALSPTRRVVAAVEQAWFEQQPLELRYCDSAGRSSHRRVRIVGVVMERGFTLLRCNDLDLGAERNFRFDRIEAAGALVAR